VAWRGHRLATIWMLWAASASGASPAIVDDVTQLNPIAVREIITPTTVEEVVAAVRSNAGPISIGGGRYSMGGQTATTGAVQIDMRQLHRVVSFSPERKQITVEAGITWRELLEFLDPHGLSVRIMQTYDNFTVGGSLSVNAHGRYPDQGPIVRSIESIRVVLANGDLVEASPSANCDIFYGAIGGYGALGVIVEATLALAEDVHVERRSVVMPLKAYRDYFERNVRDRAEVIFHNADLYPDAFDTVRATSYVSTAQPVTVTARLQPLHADYLWDRRGYRLVADVPGGKWIREHAIDPWLFRGECIEWRNYEASYDVGQLEPASRAASTYVLQEYFVPIDRLESFAQAMARVLQGHHVNAINVSIRHAMPDPGTYLAWARGEVFSLVLYYKQGRRDEDRAAVGVWTRELIDAAIAAGGTYYLPYQIWATKGQFQLAYPNAAAFFAVRRRYDPAHKFRNRLLDAYDGER
jgi:FAD/FMN-containing dehydrogenase